MTPQGKRPATPGFPRVDDLCERCGYELQGLDPAGLCPECGLGIAASDPVHRGGLPWQDRQTPGAWLATAGRVVASPRHSFRVMRVGGSNAAARLFMLSVAMFVGVGWGLFAWAVEERPPVVAWGLGMVAAKSAVLLTYIETLGVAGFSRRRGWRVPFALAERVACYAAVGWVLVAFILAQIIMLMNAGYFDAAAAGRLGSWNADYGLLVWMFCIAVALLGFEVLIGTGIRQVRYANARSEQ